MTLKERRENLGLLQEDVANQLEVDQSTISNWERGRSIPYRKFAVKLAALYKCSVDEILKSNGFDVKK